jgi:hypothetical protein
MSKEVVMRLKRRDVGATLLVVAIAVPYVGFLVRGEMPPIEDARGMTGTAFVLAALAYVVVWRGDGFDGAGKLEAAMAVVSLSLGVVAYELSETAAAETLLALFMVSIVAVWGVKLADHIGVLPWHAGRPVRHG